MKILIVPRWNMPISTSSITGGVEMVQNVQIETLSKQHEVFYVATKECDQIPGAKKIEVPALTYYNIEKNHDKAKARKIRDAAINNICEKEGIDVIVTHDEKTVVNNEVPIVYFLHGVPDHMGTSVISYKEKFKKLVDKGHVHFVSPSDHCSSRWNMFVEGMNNQRLPIFIADPHKDSINHQLYGILVTRLADEKDIDVACEMAKWSNLSLKVVFSHKNIFNEKSNELFESLKKFEEHGVEFIDNDALSREEVLDLIAGATLGFIPSEESFSIFARECLTLGVPFLSLSRWRNPATMERCSQIIGDSFFITREHRERKKSERIMGLSKKAIDIAKSSDFNKRRGIQMSTMVLYRESWYLGEWDLFLNSIRENALRKEESALQLFMG